jgi:hypothetical protein
MRPYASQKTIEEWQEFDQDELEQAIRKLAGNSDLGSARQLASQAQRAFEDDKPEVLSLLTTAITEQDDPFLTRLKEEADAIQALTYLDVVRCLRPAGAVWSQDSLAISQGFHTPPHMSVLYEVIALRQYSDACRKLAHIVRKAGSHLARKQRQLRKTQEIGTNVFIGHGHSPLWKDGWFPTKVRKVAEPSGGSVSVTQGYPHLSHPSTMKIQRKRVSSLL